MLLGHTRDDQAETVLLGLARGSGARALAGMPARRGRYRRPLLGVGRATLREACAAQGLEPWDDPHNADPAYARVRVRRQAMPALEEALGPGVAAALARSAAQLSADCDALDALAAAEGWPDRAATRAAGGRRTGGALAVVVLDIEGLAELAPAIRHGCCARRRWPRAARPARWPPAHVAAWTRWSPAGTASAGRTCPGRPRPAPVWEAALHAEQGGPAGAGPPEPTEAEATGGRE